MRILQRKTRRQQVVLVEVEHRAVEQLQAARIDEDLRAIGAYEHQVGIPGVLIPRKRVAEPRAAARLHGDPETAAGLLLLEQLLVDHARCALSDFNHFDSSIAFKPASTAMRAVYSRSGARSNCCTTRSGVTSSASA